jgi:hypothetical protein
MPELRVRTIVLAALGLIAALAVGARATFAQARTPSGTAVRIYFPFAAHGQIVAGLHVRRNVRGYCWVGSIVAYRRANAWRCFVGNEIHDPCFSSKFVRDYVLCSDAPWSSAVTRIRLAKSLPYGNNPSDPTRGEPWALKLASGTTCGFMQGATAFVGGKRLNYGCTNGLTLYGDPRRTRPQWTILASHPHSHRLAPVGITVAWW